MDYYGLMHLSPRLLAAPFLVMSLSAGAIQAQTFGPSAPLSGPSLAASARAPAPPVAAEDQTAELDAELFYEIFLGELTLQSGDPGAGYSLMLEAARRSKDEQIFKRAADIALQSRSGEAALAAARAWEAALPDSYQAQRYLLQTLLALNRTAETGPSLRRLLDTAEPATRKQLLLTLPLLYRKVSDKAVALQIVSQALDRYATDPALAPAAAISIARMELLAAEPAKALISAQRAASLDPTSEDVALMTLDLLEAKVDGSAALAQAAFSREQPPQLRMGYAKALLESDLAPAAQAELEKLTASHPEFSQAWLALAALQLQNGSVQPAETSLAEYEKAAAKIASSDEERVAASQIYMLRSEIAEKRGNFAEAQDWLERIDDASTRFNVQARRAILMARDGKLTYARALVQSLPAHSPEEESRKKALDVQVLREGGAYAEAYALQAELVKQSPNDVELLYDQAMLADKAGDRAAMERILRQIITTKPAFYHAFNALGYSFAERGENLPEARQLIEIALRLAPGDPFITDSLAWVEYRAGNFKRSLELLQEAYAKRKDAEIAAHYGEVLWASGDQARARAIWSEAQSLNANNPTLLETLKRLGVTL